MHHTAVYNMASKVIAVIQSFPFQLKQEVNGLLQVEIIWACRAHLSTKWVHEFDCKTSFSYQRLSPSQAAKIAGCQLKRKTLNYSDDFAGHIINSCMMHLGLTTLSLVLHIKSGTCILFPVFCQCSSWHLGLQHRHDTKCSICYKYIWLFS